MKNFRLQRLSSNQIALITSDYDAMRIPKHQMALITSGNQVKMKNFWRKPGQSTDYMGINAIYRTQDGFPFEVQYHTPESIDTKMQRCHHSYEKFREDHSMAKAQYWVRCEPPVLFVSVLPYLLVQQLRMHLLPVFEVSAPLPAWQAPKGYMSTTRTQNCILRVNIRPPPPCRCLAGENGMQ